MGGHKGIGIAMMVECLAGAMTATSESLQLERNAIREGGAVGRQGAFLWMVNPKGFTEEDHFARYMSQCIEGYFAAGGEQARLPGRRGGALEKEAGTHGIVLAAATEQQLLHLGAQVDIAFPQ
jgi:LDH2 family malate/lactate/ureidoglycolate dehydrogenase